MTRRSTLHGILQWFAKAAAPDRAAATERALGEVEFELDQLAASGVAPDETRAIARGCLDLLARTGPYTDAATYGRFLVLAARALAQAGGLAEVPAFLDAAAATLPKDASVTGEVRGLADRLRTVAAAVADGTIAPPRLAPGEARMLGGLREGLSRVAFAGEGGSGAG